MTLGPLVSIVVPIYNMEKYLARCLDSLVGQSLRDIEIICVDDGSTDSGPEILAGYAVVDDRIKILRQPNQGVAAARNAGLGLVAGRYMASVDPDDWLEPETCGKAANLLTDDPELDYVAWSSQVVYDVGGDRPEATAGLRDSYQVRYVGRRQVTGEVWLNTVPNVCNKMFRFDIIKKHGLTFPPLPVGEDGAFWHKFAAHAGHGYYLDEPLYNYYRGRSDSATSLGGMSTLADSHWLSVWEDVGIHCRRHGLLDEDLSATLARLFLQMYYECLHRARERGAVRAAATRLAREFDLPNLEGGVIRQIKAGRDHERAGYSLPEKIFSIKNRDRNKVVTFLGLEIKIGGQGGNSRKPCCRPEGS